jgi:hypothetical protein
MQATAENLLIRMVKEEKGKIRLEAMRLLLIVQGKMTAQQSGIDAKSGLAGELARGVGLAALIDTGIPDKVQENSAQDNLPDPDAATRQTQ